MQREIIEASIGASLNFGEAKQAREARGVTTLRNKSEGCGVYSKDFAQTAKEQAQQESRGVRVTIKQRDSARESILKRYGVLLFGRDTRTLFAIAYSRSRSCLSLVEDTFQGASLILLQGFIERENKRTGVVTRKAVSRDLRGWKRACKSAFRQNHRAAAKHVRLKEIGALRATWEAPKHSGTMVFPARKIASSMGRRGGRAAENAKISADISALAELTQEASQEAQLVESLFSVITSARLLDVCKRLRAGEAQRGLTNTAELERIREVAQRTEATRHGAEAQERAAELEARRAAELEARQRDCFAARQEALAKQEARRAAAKQEALEALIVRVTFRGKPLASLRQERKLDSAPLPCLEGESSKREPREVYSLPAFMTMTPEQRAARITFDGMQWRYLWAKRQEARQEQARQECGKI